MFQIENEGRKPMLLSFDLIIKKQQVDTPVPRVGPKPSTNKTRPSSSTATSQRRLMSTTQAGTSQQGAKARSRSSVGGSRSRSPVGSKVARVPARANDGIAEVAPYLIKSSKHTVSLIIKLKLFFHVFQKIKNFFLLYIFR